MFISSSILLRIRNISHNFVAKVKTAILFSLNFAPKIVSFMMWKNMVQPDRPQMKI